VRGIEPDPVFCSPVASQAALSSLLYDSKAASSALPGTQPTVKNSTTSAAEKLTIYAAEDDGILTYV
ncbi:MAG: hypothetical protein N2Z65_01540, partial [Clostridiales bacterium]|nr:hypothetical protein [Clostridiales bacterium]